MIRARNRREKAELRREQLQAYNTAALAVSILGSALAGKQPPDFTDCFPQGAEGEKTDEAAIVRQMEALTRMMGGTVINQRQEGTKWQLSET